MQTVAVTLDTVVVAVAAGDVRFSFSTQLSFFLILSLSVSFIISLFPSLYVFHYFFLNLFFVVVPDLFISLFLLISLSLYFSLFVCRSLFLYLFMSFVLSVLLYLSNSIYRLSAYFVVLSLSLSQSFFLSMYALLSRFIPSLFSFSLCPTFPQSLHKSPHGTFSYKYPRHSPLCLPFDLDTADGKRDIGQHRHPDQRSHCDTVNTHFLTTSHTNLSHHTLLFDAKTNVQARLYFFSQTHITQVHSVSVSLSHTNTLTDTHFLLTSQAM